MLRKRNGESQLQSNRLLKGQQNNSTGQMMVSKTTEPPHVELVGPCLTPYTRLPQNGSNQGPFHDHRWAVVQAHSHEKWTWPAQKHVSVARTFTAALFTGTQNGSDLNAHHLMLNSKYVISLCNKKLFTKKEWSRALWCTPTISAFWEAEASRWQIWAQRRQLNKTLPQKMENG